MPEGVGYGKTKVKSKTKTGKAWVQSLKRTFKSYSDARFRFERNWYIADNFFDGNHFVWFKRESGTIDKITAPKGTVLRSIPKASKQVEAVQNLIVSNNYRWTAYPEPGESGDVSDVSEDHARRQGQWLRTQFDEMNMDNKVGDLVLYALKFPVSFWEFSPNDAGDSVECKTYDAFDFYFKPNVESIYDSPIVFKTIEKEEDEIRANPDYTIPEGVNLTGNDRPYASELKSIRYNEKFGYKTGMQSQKNTITLYEAWIKEWYKEEKIVEVDTGSIDEITGETVKIQETKEERKMRVRVVTYLERVDEPLRNVVTPYSDYPFVAFSPKSGALYQPAMLERLMSANKSIDLIVSGIETFMHTMNKGRFMKHRNASLSKIYNETGQILEWDVEKPELIPQQALPSHFFQHIANLEKWIEEQSVSGPSIGRNPSGVRAYKTVEALKSSDVANQGVAIKQLELALEKAAEICLEIADKYFDEPQNVYRMDKEKPDYFKVIGSRYYDEDNSDQEGVVPLSENTKINVSVESGLSYTEEGKRQTLIELYNLGLLNKETVLEGFKFGNIGEILAKVEAEVQQSMIDTADFQALDDDTKRAVLEELMAKNISIRQDPQALEDRKPAERKRRLR